MQHNGEPRYVMQTTVPFTKPDGTVTVGLARVPLPEMLQPPPGSMPHMPYAGPRAMFTGQAYGTCPDGTHIVGPVTCRVPEDVYFVDADGSLQPVILPPAQQTLAPAGPGPPAPPAPRHRVTWPMGQASPGHVPLCCVPTCCLADSGSLDVAAVVLARMIDRCPLWHAYSSIPVDNWPTLPAFAEAMLDLAERINAGSRSELAGHDRHMAVARAEVSAARDGMRHQFGHLLADANSPHAGPMDVLAAMLKAATPEEAGGVSVMASFLGRAYDVTVQCQACGPASADTYHSLEYTGAEVPGPLSVSFVESDLRSCQEQLQGSVAMLGPQLSPAMILAITEHFAFEHACDSHTVQPLVVDVAVDQGSPFLIVNVEAPLGTSNMSAASRKLTLEPIRLGKVDYRLLAVLYRRKHEQESGQRFFVEMEQGARGMVLYDARRPIPIRHSDPKAQGWYFLTGAWKHYAAECWNVVGLVYMRHAFEQD